MRADPARATGAEPRALADVTIGSARRELARRFREAGLDSPDLDARLLVGHALGLDHAAMAAQSERTLSSAEAAAVTTLADRRLAREPVARILGTREFWSLPLALNPHTLVPRPETETIVEAALGAIGHDGTRGRPLRIVDFGTGTGALLLALLSELPNARGVGTDISPEALVCARRNAHVHGMGSRAVFLACDYGAALQGPFDLLVANPPYVAHGDLAALPPEVGTFDPRRALDGGRDGLDGYRALAHDARRLVPPRGIAVLELGIGQAAAVGSIMEEAGFGLDGPARKDLAGIPRALVLRRRP